LSSDRAIYILAQNLCSRCDKPGRSELINLQRIRRIETNFFWLKCIHYTGVSLLSFGALDFFLYFLPYRRVSVVSLSVSLCNQFVIKLSGPQAKATLYLADTLPGIVVRRKRNSAPAALAPPVA